VFWNKFIDFKFIEFKGLKGYSSFSAQEDRTQNYNQEEHPIRTYITFTNFPVMPSLLHFL